MSALVEVPREMLENIADLRLPHRADHWLQSLMDRNANGALTDSEKDGLAALVEMSASLSLMRAKADHRLLRESVMTRSAPDTRSPARRALDEQIAAEPTLPPPELPVDAAPLPVEAHLHQRNRRPLAVAGVVENGLVRPLDPTVKLSENSRVIIVTAEVP